MRLSILVVSFLLTTPPLWGKIAFMSVRDGNSGIYVMNSFGNNPTRLTDYADGDGSPAWAPNGRQIAFDRCLFNRQGVQNYEVYVMDADGRNQCPLTDHPAFDAYPDWSPDGAQIAFVSTRGPRQDPNIYVMDADGSNVTQITHVEWAGEPMWSPDGRYIGFQANIDLNRQTQHVYVIDSDGTNRWQVSEPLPGMTMSFDGWSPDGTQILYKATVGLTVKTPIPIIATLSLKRRKAVKHEQVPIPKMDANGFAWGADGKSILMALRKSKEEKWDIYRFSLPDGPLVQLTDHPASDYWPREWNPRLSVSPQRLAPKHWGAVKSD